MPGTVSLFHVSNNSIKGTLQGEFIRRACVTTEIFMMKKVVALSFYTEKGSL